MPIHVIRVRNLSVQGTVIYLAGLDVDLNFTSQAREVQNTDNNFNSLAINQYSMLYIYGFILKILLHSISLYNKKKILCY